MHSINNSLSGAKKDEKISFRTDSDFIELVKELAEKEEIPVADFMRKLTRISLRIYREAGSLHELRKKFGEEASPREKRKSG